MARPVPGSTVCPSRAAPLPCGQMTLLLPTQGCLPAAQGIRPAGFSVGSREARPAVASPSQPVRPVLGGLVPGLSLWGSQSSFSLDLSSPLFLSPSSNSHSSTPWTAFSLVTQEDVNHSGKSPQPLRGTQGQPSEGTPTLPGAW